MADKSTSKTWKGVITLITVAFVAFLIFGDPFGKFHADLNDVFFLLVILGWVAEGRISELNDHLKNIEVLLRKP
jgi:hypothetical protein